MSKNQECLQQCGVVEMFFRAVYQLRRTEGWASDEHFTVAGTLIESAASLKSFVPKDQKPQAPGDDPGNPTVNFHGQQRRNDTHQSTTDPEARLHRKGWGKQAKL